MSLRASFARSASAGALFGVMGIGACGVDNPLQAPRALDEAFFRCEVQPVLVRQCAMPACHGNGVRYFRVYARNRLRYGATPTLRDAPLTSYEWRANYDAARALVQSFDDPRQSLLVLKPLEPSAGGYFHNVAKVFRGAPDVFGSRTDAEFQVLEAWAAGARADPACPDPGEAPAP